MDCITGDETGLIKVCDISKREFLTYGKQDRLFSIEGMSWLSELADNKTFSVLRANSCLESWSYEPGSSSLLKSILLPIKDPLNVAQIDNSAVVCVGKTGNIQIAKYIHGSDTTSSSSSSTNWKMLKSFEVKGPLNSVASCKGGAVFGGSENDIVLYDMNTQQPSWSARNVPYDTLRLRVPICKSILLMVKHNRCIKTFM